MSIVDIRAVLTPDSINKLKGMLAGGPPYRLTFTEECLREILEAQR